MHGIAGALKRAQMARLARQARTFASNADCVTRNGPGPRQYGAGAPFFLGYFHAGVHRAILERASWALFFLIPIEGAWIFYDFGYRRVDTEMGPWVTDNHRYDGTEYDDTEKQVRFRWATDGTLAQTDQEHAEVLAKHHSAVASRLRLDMKKERGQLD